MELESVLIGLLIGFLLPIAWPKIKQLLKREAVGEI